MKTYLRDLGAVLAAFGLPFRDFFRWNAAKALILAYVLAASFVLALPGVAGFAVCAVAVAGKVPAADLNVLVSQSDPDALRESLFNVVAAVGPWWLTGALASVGWIVAALAFAFGYGYQALYLGAVLRASQGERFPVRSNLWFSGLALRKYLWTFSWWSLWALLATVGLAVVDVVIKELLGRLGWADPIAPLTPYSVVHNVFSYGLALWLTLRFGFAPLFMLSDLRAARSGWSYVAESWRFSSGRRFWRLAARWVPCMAALAFVPVFLAAALAAFGTWFVPAVAFALAAVHAGSGQGPVTVRWTRALGAAALFCLAYLAAVVAANLFLRGLFGDQIFAAYFPPSAALVAAFAFAGLEGPPVVALWRRERARA